MANTRLAPARPGTAEDDRAPRCRRWHAILDRRVTYFAYGSNLDPAQFSARCPAHEVMGAALLPDHRLCFPRRSPIRGCAVASIEPDPGERVWGVIYRLCPEDLAELHRREGFDPSGPEEANRYVLRSVTVLLGGDPQHVAEAFTYVARPTRDPGLPSRDYLGHLSRGAAHHRLPETWRAFLDGLPFS